MSDRLLADLIQNLSFLILYYFMYPIIYDFGFVSINSFGVMMALAFIAANYFAVKELTRKKMQSDMMGDLVIIAAITGILGSKLFHIFENWSDFLAQPKNYLLTFSGLTFYGGLIVAGITLSVLAVKKYKLNLRDFIDALAPSLILAYGIGRIGCQLAGDGDYGRPTDQNWGFVYDNAIVKPTNALREYFIANPDEANKLNYYELSSQPSRIDYMGYRVNKFDETVKLHPTPVYETIYSIIIFGFLMWLGRRLKTPGVLFMVYLFLAGLSRFIVEFWRINHELAGGFSQAQWISIILMVFSSLTTIYFYRGKDPA